MFSAISLVHPHLGPIVLLSREHVQPEVWDLAISIALASYLSAHELPALVPTIVEVRVESYLAPLVPVIFIVIKIQHLAIISIKTVSI